MTESASGIPSGCRASRRSDPQFTTEAAAAPILTPQPAVPQPLFIRIEQQAYFNAVRVVDARVQAGEKTMPYVSGLWNFRIERNSRIGCADPERKIESVTAVGCFANSEKFTPRAAAWSESRGGTRTNSSSCPIMASKCLRASEV